MIETLFRYNDWANSRIFKLAEGLTDAQLDSQLELGLGLGSLRATLHHIWAAEQVWLERWQGITRPTFPADAFGVSLIQIADMLLEVASKRKVILDNGREDGWSSVVTYRDFKQNEHSNALVDMLMHVANHGIHHRAQALHFLRQFSRTAVGGIDFLFYRIAHPSTPLITDYVEPMRKYGLEVDTAVGEPVNFRKRLIEDYFSYHDWAIQQLLPLVQQLDSKALHQDRNMGVGSIHQTLAHLRDAEKWWLGIWRGSKDGFAKYDRQEDLHDMMSSWQLFAEQRRAIVAELDADSAARVVIANPTKLQIPFRVIESMIQLCCHGTHHRAQVANMLRQSGLKSPGIDYIVWLRSR